MKCRDADASGSGSDRVIVWKFLELFIILKLCVEQSYFLSQISWVVIVTRETKVDKLLIQK